MDRENKTTRPDASRLAFIWNDIGVSQKILAERLGCDPRTLRNWAKYGMKESDANKVAFYANLDSRFFFDPAPLFQQNGALSYLKARQPEISGDADAVSFNGNATLNLTRFLHANATWLHHVRQVTIETWEGKNFTVSGRRLGVRIEGYVRSVCVDGEPLLGGINAVAERFRLRRLTIQPHDRGTLRMVGGNLLLMTDGRLAELGDKAIETVLDLGCDLAAIHLAARRADGPAFAALEKVARLRGDDREVMEYLFDALKCWAAHFGADRGDALRAFRMLDGFLRRSANSAQMAEARLYAVEAIPFVCHGLAELRRRAVAVLMGRKSAADCHPQMECARQTALQFFEYISGPERWRSMA